MRMDGLSALCVLLLLGAQASRAMHIDAREGRRSLAGFPAFRTVIQTALQDFKNQLGNNTKTNANFWGNTWVNGATCDTWAFTGCDANGNLLNLTLSGQRLEGIIPDSFYTITTLERLILSNNRLYGRVRRNLANINPNLYYLDLSMNYFTGQYPDLWQSPSITSSLSTFATVPGLAMNNGNTIYLNISYTYFTGFRTINTSNANTQAIFATGKTSPQTLQCIGVSVQGDVRGTCLTIVGSNVATFNMDKIQEGYCRWTGVTYFSGTQAATSTVCNSWCGTNGGSGARTPFYGPCNNRLNAQCVPRFASASNNTLVGAPQCVYPAVSPPPPPPPPVSSVVNSADAAVLSALVTALGNPSALANLRNAATWACSRLSTWIGCNPSGQVTRLSLSAISGLGAQTIPTNIASLPALQILILSRNQFFGSWPFDLSTQLRSLFWLDLSSNFLTGNVPTGFTVFPTFLNYSSNYFTGDPLVQDAKGNVYCPYTGVVTWGGNCLSSYSNAPCPMETQRTQQQCSDFCGIVAQPSITSSTTVAQFVSACSNGNAGSCLPSTTQAGRFRCTGSLSPPPSPRTPPPPSVQAAFAPGIAPQLIFFASQYVNKFGSPASVFSTWRLGVDCKFWEGLTCDGTSAGNVLAVNLKGKGLIGPFPGPSVFPMFWTSTALAISSTISYFDISNNKLYGALDPMLSTVSGMDFLDFSGNFFTGTLPSRVVGKFRYFNASNNYLFGQPTLLGQDGTSAYCPGSAIFGSLDGNCFDLPPTTSCPRAITNKAFSTCRNFCTLPGATSAGVCSSTPRTPVCKPTATGFVCSKA